MECVTNLVRRGSRTTQRLREAVDAKLRTRPTKAARPADLSEEAQGAIASAMVLLAKSGPRPSAQPRD
jgi:hypothetical protein